MSTDTQLTQPVVNEVETNSRPQESYQTVRPRVELLESNDGWLLRAEMPGVDEQHLEVTLERNVLTVTGTAVRQEPEGYARQYGEFEPRRFERAFRLPEDFSREGIDASITQGLLSIRIPKAKEAQPSRIPVRTA